MPCYPLVDSDGKSVGFICGPGPYRNLVEAWCPWCCFEGDLRVHAMRQVYSGWCAPDMICGTCGQKWTGDDDRLRPMKEDKRDENVAFVAALVASGIVVGEWPEFEG